MKKVFLFLMMVSVSLPGCSGGEKSRPSTISLNRDDIVTASSQVFTVNTGLYTYLDYSLTSEESKNAYFVFSNAGTSSASLAATVTEEIPAASDVSSTIQSTSYRGPILKDHPGTRAFEENLPSLENQDDRKMMLSASTAARNDSIDQSSTFYNANDVAISATCRYVSTTPIVTNQGSRTLSVWVANDCWHDGGTKTHLVTQEMVDALAGTFLNKEAWSSGNPQMTSLPTGKTSYDVYGLVTSIFGAEWGTHRYTNLIAADGTITILLADLNGTNTPGGYIGYFYSRDCFTNSSLGSTHQGNERLMFFLDAVSFAYSSGSWSISDYWPEEIISTLAHEFQHMIMFYQKTVSRSGTVTQTWLNEMCSLVAEDFVANYIGVAGPRGVDISYTGGSAGASEMSAARISDMVGVSGWHLYSWPSSSSTASVLAAYGQAYALGAYLARDYGGVPLFTKIVQNSYSGKDAVSAALSAQGFSESFDTAFAKFGAALLLSNSTSAPEYYRYNSGGWFTSASADGIAYSLGSINAFNYTNGYTSGPYIFSELPSTAQSAGSIVTYDAGTISGTRSWKMTLPAGTILTIVAK